MQNIPGGAVIKYAVPTDEDALSVKAVYKFDDCTPMEIKASVSSYKFTIEVIGQSREVDVAMTVVDRNRNESAPIHVTEDGDRMIHVNRFYSKAESGWCNVRNQSSVETVFVVKASAVTRRKTKTLNRYILAD